MRKRLRSDMNTRLRGGERLEDRRLLASSGGVCNLFTNAITPEVAIAFEQTPIDIGETEPVRNRRQARIALLDTESLDFNRYSLNASVSAAIDLEDTGCKRLSHKALKTTGILVFDYQNANNFKFAGFDARRNLWMIGAKHHGKQKIHDRLYESMELDATYDLRLNVDHSTVELLANGSSKVSHTYRALNHENPIGLGTLLPRPTRFQDIAIRDYFPLSETVADNLKVTQGVSEIIDVLANDAIAYDIEAALQLNQTDYTLGQVSIIDNQLHFEAASDVFGQEIIEYEVVDQLGRAVTGHVDITVTSAFPIEFDLDETELDSFELLRGTHSSIDTPDGSLHHLTGLELLDVGLPPDKFTMTTTVIAPPSTPHKNFGGQVVFDYQDERNFKFAGILAKKKRAVIAEVRNGRTFIWNSRRINTPGDPQYHLKLVVNGKQVQLLINDSEYISRQFAQPVTSGNIGLKGHRRGSIFGDLRLDNINQPAVALNAYHKIPVHQNVTLNYLMNLPPDVKLISASAAQGTVRIEDDQLIYRSAAHHWGPTTVDYELLYPNGTQVSKSLPLAPGVDYPATAQLTKFGHLESDIVMNDLGFHIQGKEFFQENQYPLPLGGYENVTNFNMLFLNELLPEDFDLLMQSQSSSRADFAEESVIFDYRDQLNYKFVGINRVVRSTQSSTLVGTIVNSIFYPVNTYWHVGEVVNGEQRILKQTRRRLNLNSNLNVKLQVRDNQIAVLANGSRITSYEFSEPLNYGAIGAYSPYFDRAYHTLSVLDPNSLPDAAATNTHLAGDIWHEHSGHLEVQPDPHGFSVHILDEPFVGPRQIETYLTTVTNTEDDLANGFVIFDYVDEENFKLAGVKAGRKSMLIGEVIDGNLQVLRSRDHVMFIGEEIKLLVSIDQSLVWLTVDDEAVITYDFADDDLALPFGFATQKSPAYFKNTRIG